MSDALPAGWATARLDEIAALNPRHPRDLDGKQTVTFVPMPAVSETSPLLDTSQERALESVRTGYTHFAENDVLFAKITPCMENGKGAVATGLRNDLGCGTTELHVVRPHVGLHPHYVYRFLAQRSVRRAAKENFTGSAGQARVPMSFMEELEIPVPPTAEQRRIVAKLETLLGKVDACQRRLAKIPRLLKRFRQSVLAAACSGRLTADWRKMAESKVDAGDQTETPDGFVALPETWRWQSLASVCESIVDCPHSTPLWSDSGRLCVRTTNFKPGLLDLSEVRFVSDVTFNQRIERLRPQPGDILYSREGGILGIACIIAPAVELCLGQRMMLFRTNETFVGMLLMHWLNSPLILRRVRELTGGSASPHLNVRDIKSFPTPIPPLPEQLEIVRRVEQLFTFADQLEARFAKAQAHVDKLTPSLLAKAFRGELVPQDPSDEPASALLARLRSETNGAEKPTRRKVRA